MTDDVRIAEALDIDLNPAAEPKNEVAVVANTEVVNSDYQYARMSIREVVRLGEQSLRELLDLAKRTEHPRMYEAITGLIKTIAESDLHLLEIQKIDAEIQQTKFGPRQSITNLGPENIQNNLYIGSTYELQKLLKKVANTEIIENVTDGEVIDGTTNE